MRAPHVAAVLIGILVFSVLVQAPRLLTGGDPHAPSALERPPLDSVVLVEALDAAGSRIGFGTGFVAAPGYVVTVAHVARADGAEGVRIVTRDDDERADATVVRLSEDRDVALLRADTEGLAPLRPDCRRPEVGERVVAIGHPHPVLWGAYWGRISSTHPVDAEPRSLFESAVFVDLGVNSGLSGAPLLTADGGVVGVVKGVTIYRLTRRLIGQGQTGVAADGVALCWLLALGGVEGY